MVLKNRSILLTLLPFSVNKTFALLACTAVTINKLQKTWGKVFAVLPSNINDLQA